MAASMAWIGSGMPDVPLLDAAEQRILGSLLEKQVTVPASYPLTPQLAAHRVQPVEQPRPGHRLRRAGGRAGRPRPQGPRPAPDRVVRHRPPDAEVPPDPGRAPGPRRRRARAGHRAAAARPAGPREPEDPDRAAASRSPTGSRSRRCWPGWPPGPSRWCASYRARPGSTTTAGSTCSGRFEEAAGPAPVPRAGVRGRAVARRAGPDVVRRGRDGVRRPPGRRARPPAVRDLAAAPGRRAGRRPPGGRGRAAARATSPHFLAQAGARATGMDLTPAMVEEARRRFPDGDYDVGDLRSLMRPASDAGLGGRPRVVLPDPPGAVGAPGRLRGADPAAAPRWLAGRRPARRRRHPRPRQLVRRRDRRDVRPPRPGPTCGRSAEAAGLVDVEWYHRGPTPAAARPPSGSTCWPGSRTDRPFTLAHPAAVLPLRGLGLPMTALVAGVDGARPAADARLLGPTEARTWSHSLPGVVTIDLGDRHGGGGPLVRRLPPAAGRPGPGPVARPAPGRGSGSRPLAWLLCVPGVVLGAATHVVWDSFTHEDDWGTEHVALLRDSYLGAAGYDWAQHLSSVFGLVVVTVAAMRYLARLPEQPPRPGPLVGSLGAGRGAGLGRAARHGHRRARVGPGGSRRWPTSA